MAAHQGLVTGLAFDSSMRSDQRKKIVVIANLFSGGEPTLHHVALCAIRAELAQMDIRMALVTILANVAEDRARMALRAR